jgi:hypothetical protein
MNDYTSKIRLEDLASGHEQAIMEFNSMQWWWGSDFSTRGKQVFSRIINPLEFVIKEPMESYYNAISSLFEHEYAFSVGAKRDDKMVYVYKPEITHEQKEFIAKLACSCPTKRDHLEVILKEQIEGALAKAKMMFAEYDGKIVGYYISVTPELSKIFKISAKARRYGWNSAMWAPPDFLELPRPSEANQ